MIRAGIVAAVLLFVFVGLEVAARVLSQNWIAAQVRSQTGARGVSVHVDTFLYLPALITSGSIAEIRLNADLVPAGFTVLNRVSVDAHQVQVDRHWLLVHHQVHVTAIARARVTVEITAPEISAGIGYPLTLTDNNKLTAQVKGVTVPADISITEGHIVTVTSAGRLLGSVDLSTSQLVPKCDMTSDTGAQAITFSCTMAPVPASLIESLSATSPKQ